METKEKALAAISEVLTDCEKEIKYCKEIFEHFKTMPLTVKYYENILLPKIEKAKELIQILKTTK